MKLTMEEAKEMLPIIQAWADGKSIDWYDEDIGWIASGFELEFDKNQISNALILKQTQSTDRSITKTNVLMK